MVVEEIQRVVGELDREKVGEGEKHTTDAHTNGVCDTLFFWHSKTYIKRPLFPRSLTLGGRVVGESQVVVIVVV